MSGAHLLPGQVTRIADQLFVIGHDEFTGRARSDLSMLNLGLAAGLLAELVSEGFISVSADTGGVWVRPHDRTPSTGITHDLLDFIKAEPRLPAADWMRFLARDDSARGQVGQRLFRAGIVTTRTERRHLRRQHVYPAVHSSAGAYAVARLGSLLDRPRHVSVDDVVVLALVVATRLSDHVGRETDCRLTLPDEFLGWLPEHVQALVVHARATLGAAALRGR